MAAIAQWNRQRPPSCGRRFKSQAQHLRFFKINTYLSFGLHCEKNEKRPRLAHFFKNCYCWGSLLNEKSASDIIQVIPYMYLLLNCFIVQKDRNKQQHLLENIYLIYGFNYFNKTIKTWFLYPEAERLEECFNSCDPWPLFPLFSVISASS